MTKLHFRPLIYLGAVIAVIALIAGLAHYNKRGATQARTITVTIIPGSTVNTIAKLLSRSGLPSQAFLKLALPDFTASTTPMTEGSGLEGYLYPDTYNFTSNESAEKIIETMTDNFEVHFPRDLYENQKGTVRGKREVVIMASILEKEVVTKEDMAIVAGILWKRLDHDLPLQVDSSGHYFFAPTGRVVYNTYQNTGLPFGPISNPSSESLEAALRPSATDYWYFLSARDGRTIYSRTLSEHLINKAKYLE